MKIVLFLVCILIGCTNITSTIKQECSYLYTYHKDFCNKYITIDVVIDSSFSNDELSYVYSGLSSWTIVSDSHIKFNIIGFDGHHYLINKPANILSIIRVSDPDLLILDIPKRPSGIYFENKVYLIMSRFPSMLDLRAIVVHEIGHHMGLSHYNSLFSIMNPIVAENVCIYESGLPTKIDFYNIKKILCEQNNE